MIKITITKKQLLYEINKLEILYSNGKNVNKQEKTCFMDIGLVMVDSKIVILKKILKKYFINKIKKDSLKIRITKSIKMYSYRIDLINKIDKKAKTINHINRNKKNIKKYESLKNISIELYNKKYIKK